ncbi:MAG TPA: 1,6-anhydro-N-acetylmuramyl-L-alanine amidase AmpD [Ottowia sp.]|uniref:1,6-anhydro-N-acetylmuramyl-L-alanine amidase AmpD n=1 Tax=Ottowia sp. TaxID=1898956 RepID=UPI002BBE23FB|nr:1,6-anhydro-N-acetylmuramyl-L-alanine amidase AmpD [Ottowia sp.]HMN20353.1 1,6-anhydro-N-acetylmuramyl-L-alanine amidase AmpD [Ottowia sp.]
MVTRATPEAVAPWQGGWHARARHLPSPNRGKRPAATPISLIVVHSISLPPGSFGGAFVQALFTNTLDWDAHPWFQQIRGIEVSAHFYVRRSGALWQFVSCDERAWHAGRSCYRGRANCNDFSIGIELEGLEGGRFTAAQYKRLGRLCSDLAARYPIDAIAGHEHIAPGRKHDPGPGFDWSRLQAGLGWPAAWFPTGVLDG